MKKKILMVALLSIMTVFSACTPERAPDVGTEDPSLTEEIEPAPSAPDGKEQSALKSAIGYLDISAFSYSELIEQLESEQYPHSEAVYAADNCGADWNEQAVRSAREYNRKNSSSLDELIERLTYEGYTEEQAVYGANTVLSAFEGTKGEKEALDNAFAYLYSMAFSYDDMVDMLEFEGHTHSDAVYAADHCEADWNEQAARRVREYGREDEKTSSSREELIERLISEGYTEEQAVYGARANGY